MAKKFPATGGRVLPAKGRGPRILPRRPRAPKRPPLRISQILAWADDHFRRTGRWPIQRDGQVLAAPTEKWSAIENAFHRGGRGLRPGSIAKLLDKYGRKRNIRTLPRLSGRQILAWADEHHRRTGRWPLRTSGRVLGDSYEVWFNIDAALREGRRGLSGGESLAQFLARQRGVRNLKGAPHLTIWNILDWARQHHRRYGCWPNWESGPVLGQPGERWNAIGTALHAGIRGLPGGDTLGQLLSRSFGVRNAKFLPKLTIRQILAWADEHHRRTGKWPMRGSGRIASAPSETWDGIRQSLARASRGLPPGWTLAGLLAHHRGYMHDQIRPPLTIQQILQWMDAHVKRTGKWPTMYSGAVVGVRGENWRAVDTALRKGHRGLRGESSISRLLRKHRGKPKHRHE